MAAVSGVTPLSAIVQLQTRNLRRTLRTFRHEADLGQIYSLARTAPVHLVLAVVWSPSHAVPPLHAPRSRRLRGAGIDTLVKVRILKCAGCGGYLTIERDRVQPCGLCQRRRVPTVPVLALTAWDRDFLRLQHIASDD